MRRSENTNVARRRQGHRGQEKKRRRKSSATSTRRRASVTTTSGKPTKRRNGTTNVRLEWGEERWKSHLRFHAADDRNDRHERERRERAMRVDPEVRRQKRIRRKRKAIAARQAARKILRRRVATYFDRWRGRFLRRIRYRELKRTKEINTMRRYVSMMRVAATTNVLKRKKMAVVLYELYFRRVARYFTIWRCASLGERLLELHEASIRSNVLAGWRRAVDIRRVARASCAVEQRHAVRRAFARWQQISRHRYEQERASERHWRLNALRKSVRRWHVLARRRSGASCATAICQNMRRRRYVVAFCDAAVQHRMLAIATRHASLTTARRGLWALRRVAFRSRLRSARRSWNDARRTRWMRRWREALRAKEREKVADAYCSRRGALDALGRLRRHAELCKRARICRTRHHIDLQRHVLLVWRLCTSDVVRNRISSAFFRQSCLLRVMSMWRKRTRRERHNRQSAILVQSRRYRRLVEDIVSWWQTRTASRVCLRRAFRIIRYGRCGYGLLCTAESARRTVHARSRVQAMENILLKWQQAKVRQSFMSIRAHAAQMRERQLRTLTYAFWWWDQWVAERRVEEYAAKRVVAKREACLMRRQFDVWKNPSVETSRAQLVADESYRFEPLRATLSPIPEDAVRRWGQRSGVRIVKKP